MKITAEISMYPLRLDYKEQVLGFLEKLHQNQGLTIRVNALSTQVQGEADLVFDAINQAVQTTFEEEVKASFVLKILPGEIDLDYRHDG